MFFAPDIPKVAASILFMCGVAWSCIPLYTKRCVALRIRTQPLLKTEYSIEATESSLTSISEYGHTLHNWNMFSQSFETDSFFILFYLGEQQFYALPKRAFAPGDEEQFRQLLMKVIPNKK